VPEVPQNIHSVERGDIWQLGEHRLMCGDSTDAADVARLMDGNRAVFCFTSPPYSDQRDYNGGKDLSTGKLAKFLQAPCDLFAVNLGMQRKDGEVFPYWDDYIYAAKQHGHKFLSWNIWDRGEAGSIGNQTAMFAISHEWVFIFGKKKDLNKTIPNKSAGELANHTGNRQKDGKIKKGMDCVVSQFSQMKTVLNCSAEKARDNIDHPARFPVKFAEHYIEACSNIDDVVLEPFCGSGSTLIACEKTGRKCFGMELDKHYCSVIIERWQQFTGKKAEKIA
jgi:DNA modification methylase